MAGVGPPRGGGLDPFWIVWAEHEPVLRNLCARMHRGRPDDAEDVLRTAMTRAWAQWSVRHSTVRNPGAWLQTVTRNVSLSYHREERRRADLLPLVFERSHGRGEPMAEQVLRRQMLATVMQTIDAMRPAIREPLIAYALYGQSYTEVAEKFGLTASAARQRIQEARRILAAALEDEPSSASRRDRSESPETPRKSDPPDGSDVVGPLLDEIAWRLRDTCVIQVKLPSGGTLEYHASFEDGLGRRKQRIRSLEVYVARHERSWRKRFVLANLLIADSRMEEGEAHLRKVLELQPRHLPSSLRLGQILVLARRLDDAVAVYEAAQRNAASAATRHHLRGLIERARAGAVFAQYAVDQRAEHLQRAVEAFEQAIAEEPRNVAHYHELGITYEAWGKPVEASAAYDAALNVDPDDVFALARSHNPLTAQGRYDLVLPRLERAVELDPNYTYALKLLVDRRACMGLVRGREGRRTLALAGRLLERSPDSADAMDAYTRYFERRGETEKCVELWRNFLTRNPANAKAWTFLGTALQRCYDWHGAAEAYIKSHSLDPAWLDVYWRGWSVLIRAGYADEARGWIAEGLQRFPNHWDMMSVIAQAQCALGEEPETYLRTAHRVVEMAPELERSWLVYGDLLLKAGRPQDALEALQRSLEITQSAPGAPVPWPLMSIGKALKRLGRDQEATRSFEHCLRLVRRHYREDSLYHWYLGVIHVEMGDLDAAERAFRRASKAGVWLAVESLEDVESRRRARAAPEAQP
ncbi:MAG: sigma-70 family RNA polymerase sigma factor [Chthonomonadales bacterium]|nr:sigma-70 family RNA polymerase sigma factor [Chthonomonadales bacterium]